MNGFCFNPDQNKFMRKIRNCRFCYADRHSQISVPTGTISMRVQLSVYHPESFILVGNNSVASTEFHVNQVTTLFFVCSANCPVQGSPITLTCTIPLGENAQAPQYIFWYQNEKMVNYDLERAVSLVCTQACSINI